MVSKANPNSLAIHAMRPLHTTAPIAWSNDPTEERAAECITENVGTFGDLSDDQNGRWSDPSFAAGRAEGQSVSLDEAVAIALEPAMVE